METTKEKSQEQADIIKSISIQIMCLDIPYLKEALKSMKESSSFKESASVLNPNYLPEDSELAQKQNEALEYLIKYVESLIEIDNMKRKIKSIKYNRNELLSKLGFI